MRVAFHSFIYMKPLNIRKIIIVCKRQIGNERTKTVLQYMVFVFISFVFWLVLTLNNSFQRDFTIPVKLASVPDSTTLISDVPSAIKISIKDRGTAMLKYALGNLPTLTLNFKTYDKGDGVFRVNMIDLRSEVRNIFNNSATITSISPDSIRLTYTNLPGKKLPVRLDLDIQPNLQYVINGPITSSVDSVVVYSDRQTLSELTEVYTYRVDEHNLTDTLRREVAISPLTGVKIVPKSVTLTIPVEQLINKRQMVPVITINRPGNVNVLTFPAMVEASFLVPQSMYKKNVDIKVAVDYNDIRETHTKMVGVNVIEAPGICKSMSLSVDSVEYLIEKY